MDEERKAMAEKVAEAINEFYDEGIAKVEDSGDSRGFYVEMKFAKEEWVLFLERDA
ncbi:hypothetical protein ACWGIV_25950 [Streptomyces sp. NPDC054844]